MHNSKLIRVLKTFHDKEWVEFKKYLELSTQNTSKVIELFNFIYRKRKNLNSKKLAMSEVRTLVSGYRSEKYVRNLMSQLYHHIEAYLTLNEFKNHEEAKKLYLFKAINKRGLFRLADNYAARTRKEWKDVNNRDHEKLELLLQLNHSHYLSNNPIKDDKNFDLLSELIISYNSHKELLYEYYKFVLINVRAIKNDDNFESSINQYGTLFSGEFSFLKTLQNLTDMLTGCEDSFDQLYNELTSDDNQFSEELAKVVYDNCRTFITKKVASGQLQYSERLLSIFEIGIDEGYLLYKGRISVTVFYNLFSTACGINKIAWARKYLDKYINLIPESTSQSIRKLAIAELHFVECEYLKSIEILNQIELLNTGMKLRQRWILICAFFVTYDDYSFIDTQINNYNQYFYYNKTRLSRINFEASLNLVRIIRMLVNNEPEDEILCHIKTAEHLTFRLRLPTIIEQRKLYAKKHGLN